MLAMAGKLPSEQTGYGFEYKWDGIRTICIWDGRRLKLQSRNLRDITHRYPELKDLHSALTTRSAVLDGEIVALDGQGRPSFSLLQRRMHVTRLGPTARQIPVVYMLFDLLHLDGLSTRMLPYQQRRELLQSLALPPGAWQIPGWQRADGDAMLASAESCGLEGIIAKRLDSIYRPGERSRDWLKIKLVRRQEFVIGGWTPGEGGHRGLIGSLLVGFYGPRTKGDPPTGTGTGLHYAGGVGTGLTGADHRQLLVMLNQRRHDRNPFDSPVPKRNAIFVRPELVAEVAFHEWTQDGILRHPVFKGLRLDKPPHEVVREDLAPQVSEERRDGIS